MSKRSVCAINTHLERTRRAVLLFNYMKQRNLTGLVSLSGTFGKNIFREIPWGVWWTTANQYAHHMEEVPTGKRRFNGSSFRSRCAQMQRALKRLGIKNPWGMHDMSALQIKRRFGMELHELWEWSYQNLDHQKKLQSPTQSFLFGRETEVGRFPWVCCLSPDKPKVTIHLDNPLAEWDHIQPILKNELDRLCDLEEFKEAERVVSLEWRIVYQDLTYLVIPIPFRHPHSLHMEKSHQSTALLQALYSFENSLRGSPIDKNRWDDLIPLEPIISWTLTVTERLYLPNKLLSLFGDQSSGSSMNQSTEHALLELENRLPVPLQEYRLRHDPLPEDSYESSTKEFPHEMDEAVFPTLMAQAQKRPLFIYREPALFEYKGGASKSVEAGRQFTERTMDKWWRTNGSLTDRPLQRDYYRMIDRDERAFWVFRNNTGSSESFYVHGVFA